MKELFMNWNYGKHACAVTGLYLLISIVGNLILGTPTSLKKTRGKSLEKRIKKLSKKEKIFNIGVTGCYVFDMTATYGIVKLLQKRMSNN